MPFKDKEKAKQYHKEWVRKNKEHVRATTNQRVKEYHGRLKLAALKKVSGLENPVCDRCGCDCLAVLEINHRNGDGKKDRTGKNNRGQGAAFYRKIVRGVRPIEDLEVLCKPCNWLHFIERRYHVAYKIVWGGTIDPILQRP